MQLDVSGNSRHNGIRMMQRIMYEDRVRSFV